MAIYHFHVTQIKRSAGSSAVASAAYRAGERLYSERYGEVNDYTKKSGVICSGILLPPNAPAAYRDRQTLWNAVEAAEKRGDAQLAYSFDIALPNELSQEENIRLAETFIQDNLISKGMIADFSVHDPDRGPGGIANCFLIVCRWAVVFAEFRNTRNNIRNTVQRLAVTVIMIFRDLDVRMPADCCN